MVSRPTMPRVGAMDPELRNSPVIQELDEEPDLVLQHRPGEHVCYFNGRSYPHGEYVASGTQVLRCDSGVWIEAGPADPDNP
jgi:hypothetical protein